MATLCEAEFDFLGVIVEKLTDKSPLLPLYTIVHEIFTLYGSSFNSFKVIGFFSSLGFKMKGPIHVEKAQKRKSPSLSRRGK